MTRFQNEKKRQSLIKRAMPQVKNLCKKYGENIIKACLANLAEYRKNLRELEVAQKKVADLQKKI